MLPLSLSLACANPTQVVEPSAPVVEAPGPALEVPDPALVVLEDERYRGYPSSPRQVEWVNAPSPEELAMHRAESHAATYRSCSYRVSVAEKEHRFTQTRDSTLGRPPGDWCEQAREHVAAQVQRTTQGCTDLHRGAWHGADLVPLDPSTESSL